MATGNVQPNEFYGDYVIHIDMDISVFLELVIFLYTRILLKR